MKGKTLVITLVIVAVALAAYFLIRGWKHERFLTVKSGVGEVDVMKGKVNTIPEGSQINVTRKKPGKYFVSTAAFFDSGIDHIINVHGWIDQNSVI